MRLAGSARAVCRRRPASGINGKQSRHRSGSTDRSYSRNPGRPDRRPGSPHRPAFPHGQAQSLLHIFFIGLTDRRTGNFGKALIDFGPHAGPDNPRAVGVHGDPAAGVLFRCRLGQGANGKFSGGIDPQQAKPSCPAMEQALMILPFCLRSINFFSPRPECPIASPER